MPPLSLPRNREEYKGELSTYIGRRADLYWSDDEAISVAMTTYMRLLLCVGRKVVDEWQISLGYVRGSNISVRGHWDLRAWSLRLRA